MKFFSILVLLSLSACSLRYLPVLKPRKLLGAPAPRKLLQSPQTPHLYTPHFGRLKDWTLATKLVSRLSALIPAANLEAIYRCCSLDEMTKGCQTGCQYKSECAAQHLNALNDAVRIIARNSSIGSTKEDDSKEQQLKHLEAVRKAVFSGTRVFPEGIKLEYIPGNSLKDFRVLVTGAYNHLIYSRVYKQPDCGPAVTVDDFLARRLSPYLSLRHVQSCGDMDTAWECNCLTKCTREEYTDIPGCKFYVFVVKGQMVQVMRAVTKQNQGIWQVFIDGKPIGIFYE